MASSHDTEFEWRPAANGTCDGAAVVVLDREAAEPADGETLFPFDPLVDKPMSTLHRLAELVTTLRRKRGIVLVSRRSETASLFAVLVRIVRDGMVRALPRQDISASALGDQSAAYADRFAKCFSFAQTVFFTFPDSLDVETFAANQQLWPTQAAGSCGLSCEPQFVAFVLGNLLHRTCFGVATASAVKTLFVQVRHDADTHALRDIKAEINRGDWSAVLSAENETLVALVKQWMWQLAGPVLEGEHIALLMSAIHSNRLGSLSATFDKLPPPRSHCVLLIASLLSSLPLEMHKQSDIDCLTHMAAMLTMQDDYQAELNASDGTADAPEISNPLPTSEMRSWPLDRLSGAVQILLSCVLHFDALRQALSSTATDATAKSHQGSTTIASDPSVPIFASIDRPNDFWAAARRAIDDMALSQRLPSSTALSLRVRAARRDRAFVDALGDQVVQLGTGGAADARTIALFKQIDARGPCEPTGAATTADDTSEQSTARLSAALAGVKIATAKDARAKLSQIRSQTRSSSAPLHTEDAFGSPSIAAELDADQTAENVVGSEMFTA
ncbi:hypothetical protein HK105_204324 [Polyrhizophydium stewartii]|uniref:Uncharacterized protein n=1 Tax=Polyrhizophydium stewartii TaxID=2732419 RepID=A0ABR4N9P8_9FUNG